MKIKAMDLVKHIDKASMGRLVSEAVFGNGLSFAVTDETRSVVSICKGIGTSDGENGEIGILNLKSFSRAVKYAKDIIFANGQEIDMKAVNNRLVFENGDSELKFPLCSLKLISTTVANADEVIAKISAGEVIVVTLTPATISQCLKAIQQTSPAKCTFVVESDSVTLFVGNETERNAVVDLGSVKGKGEFKLVVNPKYLAKVLGVLRKEPKVTLELRNAMPVIIAIDSYTFLVASMEVK